METFSALLAICAGNSPVTGEFPAQRPVTRSFDIFFDLCLTIRLSKQSWGWWFETPSRLLWRHCNGSSWPSLGAIPSEHLAQDTHCVMLYVYERPFSMYKGILFVIDTFATFSHFLLMEIIHTMIDNHEVLVLVGARHCVNEGWLWNNSWNRVVRTMFYQTIRHSYSRGLFPCSWFMVQIYIT